MCSLSLFFSEALYFGAKVNFVSSEESAVSLTRILDHSESLSFGVQFWL